MDAGTSYHSRLLPECAPEECESETNIHGLTYSHQKEYVEWLTEAKRNATREQRLATALEWLTEGKTRMWKYQPKRS